MSTLGDVRGQQTGFLHVAVAFGGIGQRLVGGVEPIQLAAGEHLLCRCALLLLAEKHYSPARALVVGAAYGQPPIMRVEPPPP